jgi:hypothetical protein
MPAKTKKTAFGKILLSSLMIVLGCILPLLIIHFDRHYAHWQPLLMEALSLSGLGLLFGQLLLNK